MLAGKVTLGETAGFLGRCPVLLTNDTGPMHMAAALAVPVVAVFGPTNPAKFGPFTSLATVLRHEAPCPHCGEPCIHSVSVDEVVAAGWEQYRGQPVPAHAQPRADRADGVTADRS